MIAALITAELETTAASADVKIWVLGGAATLLIGVAAYFLAKEVRRNDKAIERIDAGLEKLNTAIMELTLAIKDMRIWVTDNFVSQREFDKAITDVKNEVGIGKRLESALSNALQKQRGNQ